MSRDSSSHDSHMSPMRSARVTSNRGGLPLRKVGFVYVFLFLEGRQTHIHARTCINTLRLFNIHILLPVIAEHI